MSSLSAPPFVATASEWWKAAALANGEAGGGPVVPGTGFVPPTEADCGWSGELAEDEEAAEEAAAAAVKLVRKCTAAACRLCGGTWLKILKSI